MIVASVHPTDKGLYFASDNSATSSKMAPVVGSIIWILLCLTIASLLIAGIVILVQQIPCSYPARNTYEFFADEISDRLTKIQEIKKTLIESLSLLNDSATDTCQIFSQVRDAYVAERAALVDSELFLPKDQQTTITTKRRAEAEKTLKNETATLASIENIAPVLECFEDQSSPELILLTAVIDLERILETPEVKTARDRIDSIITTLRFNAPYLEKASIALTKRPPGTVKRPTEAFENPLPSALVEESKKLSRDKLFGRADIAIQRATVILTQITSIQKTVSEQYKVSKAVTEVQNRKSVL